MRKNQMVLLAHCLLNVNAKVDGYEPYEAMCQELIELLGQRGFGILQLPCPEMLVCGRRRFGMVKEQYEHKFYKDAIRQALYPTLCQVQSHLQAGARVAAVIGIDGSPNCGVSQTCRSSAWRGELSLLESQARDELLATVHAVSEKGVFMEVLGSELESMGMPLPFLAVDETNPIASLETLAKNPALLEEA